MFCICNISSSYHVLSIPFSSSYHILSFSLRLGLYVFDETTLIGSRWSCWCVFRLGQEMADKIAEERVFCGTERTLWKERVAALQKMVDFTEAHASNCIGLSKVSVGEIFA